MSTTTTERIVWGEAFDADFSASAVSPSVAPDFATTPVTLVWDSIPAAGSGVSSVRRVYRWRPAGTSDPQFSLSGGVLRFTLTSVQVAGSLSPGNWRVYWCVGPAATTQDAVGSLAVFVEGPPSGAALPTGDA